MFGIFCIISMYHNVANYESIFFDYVFLCLVKLGIYKANKNTRNDYTNTNGYTESFCLNLTKHC